MSVIPSVHIVFQHNKNADKHLNEVISLIWACRFQEIGDFEIVTTVSDAMQAGVGIDDVIQLYYPPFNGLDLTASSMIVERISYKTDLEYGDTCVISGRECTILFSRFAPTALNVDYLLPYNVKQAISYAIASCNVGKLIGSTLSFNTYFGDNVDLTTMVLPSDLTVGMLMYGNNPPSSQTALNCSPYDVMTTFGLIFGFGIRTSFSQGTSAILPNFDARPYAGLDRSDTVIFSKEKGNLLSSEYTEDYYDHVNCVSIRGSNLSYDWNSPSVNPNEITISTRRKTVLVDGERVPVTSSQAKSIAERYASEHQATATFQCRVIPDNPYKYGVDYNLGDIVKIDDGLGHVFRAMITEAVTNYDENGGYLNPTFELI